jgi:hypothetical protein
MSVLFHTEREKEKEPVFLVYNVALLLGGGSDELSFSLHLSARLRWWNQPSRLISSAREPSDAPNRLHTRSQVSVHGFLC